MSSSRSLENDVGGKKILSAMEIWKGERGPVHGV